MTRLIENQKTRSVLLSARIFDEATITSTSGGDVGFPVENLQNPQPKLRWRTVSENPWFVVDLQQPPYNTVPLIDTIGFLFHNAEVGGAFRVRTDNGASGIGNFDSGVLPIWPIVPTPPADSFKNPLAYQPEGAHTYFTVNGLKGIEDPSGFIWLDFPGSTGDFVSFGDNIDRPNGWIALQFRNEGPPAEQMLMCKGVGTVLTSSFTGWYIGLLSNGEVIAGIGGGLIFNSVVLSGGDYTDNDWHTVTLFHDQAAGSMTLFVDGVEVDSVASGVGDSSNTAPLEWGISSGDVQAFSGDIERAIAVNFTASGQNGVEAWIEGWLAAEDPDAVPLTIPNTTPLAVWPVTDTPGPSVLDRVGSMNGSIQGNVDWNQQGIPYLRDRFMRIDFFLQFDVETVFRMGRVVMGRALQPIVPYPAALPTPIGSPPKPQVSWPVRLTLEQYEEIGYLLAYDRGNAPDTLESWGHDIHLIDGGKTVVAVNHILAAEPWQRHQQTTYGFIQSLDEVSKENTGLVHANLTVRGI